MQALTFVFRSNLEPSKVVSVQAQTMRHAMLVAADKLGIPVSNVVFVRIGDASRDTDSAA